MRAVAERASAQRHATVVPTRDARRTPRTPPWRTCALTPTALLAGSALAPTTSNRRGRAASLVSAVCLRPDASEAIATATRRLMGRNWHVGGLEAGSPGSHLVVPRSALFPTLNTCVTKDTATTTLHSLLLACARSYLLAKLYGTDSDRSVMHLIGTVNCVLPTPQRQGVSKEGAARSTKRLGLSLSLWRLCIPQGGRAALVPMAVWSMAGIRCSRGRR